MIGHRKRECQDKESGSGKERAETKFQAIEIGGLTAGGRKGGGPERPVTSPVGGGGICMTSALSVNALLWKRYMRDESGLFHFTAESSCHL
jgi:hypothetical protein